MGTTISKEGATVEEVLDILKEAIEIAVNHGMFPDSQVSLRNIATKEYRLFKVNIEGSFSEGVSAIKFDEIPIETPINSATACAIQVTVNYSKKPKKGNWQGCIHLE